MFKIPGNTLFCVHTRVLSAETLCFVLGSAWGLFPRSGFYFLEVGKGWEGPRLHRVGRKQRVYLLCQDESARHRLWRPGQRRSGKTFVSLPFCCFISVSCFKSVGWTGHGICLGWCVKGGGGWGVKDPTPCWNEKAPQRGSRGAGMSQDGTHLKASVPRFAPVRFTLNRKCCPVKLS